MGDIEFKMREKSILGADQITKGKDFGKNVSLAPGNSGFGSIAGAGTRDEINFMPEVDMKEIFKKPTKNPDEEVKKNQI